MLSSATQQEMSQKLGGTWGTKYFTSSLWLPFYAQKVESPLSARIQGIM